MKVKVERMGGLGGFGLPGSRLRSRGEIDTDHLSAADRQAVDALFEGSAQPGSSKPDAFRYRLTCHDDTGGTRTVEAAQDQVPQSLQDCAQDELI
jgi:Emfourin